MVWNFGDSFDLYASFNDAANGFWDALTNSGASLVAGRFAGSQAVYLGNSGVVALTKSSGVNDAVHHLVCAFRQTATISGTNLSAYMQLLDGATAQCSIVFQSGGSILLTSGAPTGTVLATFSGAFSAINTWYAFEFEVVVNNTTGSFAVRKNGNTVNDFTATSLNTRNSTNNYANKLILGTSTGGVGQQQFDDVFWQSGAATGTWLGDIRCYTRMPASDVSKAFSPLSPITLNFSISGTAPDGANTARYSQFTSYAGTVGSVAAFSTAAYAVSVKMAIFADTGSNAPGAVLATATPLASLASGANTFTFPTPPSLTAGAKYWIGVCINGSVTWSGGTEPIGMTGTAVAYAAWPVASPAVSSNNPIAHTIYFTPAGNFAEVSEAQQDGLTSYVYDINPGDADFYGLAGTAGTPVAVIATTVRGYLQKSDAGTRSAAIQLKSGATTVATPTTGLSSSGFLWAWRTDVNDPNTSAPWAPSSVNVVQIGPVVIS